MKEVVELTISTFRGSIGGEHWYGRFDVHTKCAKTPTGGRVSSSRDPRHANDGAGVTRKITAKEARYLTKKDNEGFFKPTFVMKAGDETNRFDDIPSIIARAIEIFPTLFDETDVLVIDKERWRSGELNPLLGPEAIVSGLAADTDYAAQHMFLEANGYLLRDASVDERPQDQDPKGLEAKPASAVGAAETPKTPLSHAEAKQPALSTGQPISKGAGPVKAAPSDQ